MKVLKAAFYCLKVIDNVFDSVWESYDPENTKHVTVKSYIFSEIDAEYPKPGGIGKKLSKTKFWTAIKEARTYMYGKNRGRKNTDFYINKKFCFIAWLANNFAMVLGLNEDLKKKIVKRQINGILSTLPHYERQNVLNDIPIAELPEIILARNPEQKTPLRELYQGVPEGQGR